MRCPFCGADDTQVKDSRPTDDRGAIRRRRFCPNCAARFTTFERVQLRELTVIKKNGQREPFERDKLARSIYVALRKRPVEAERVERIINSLVRQLESAGETEIPSDMIGELVMEALVDARPGRLYPLCLGLPQFPRGEGFRRISWDASPPTASERGRVAPQPRRRSPTLPGGHARVALWIRYAAKSVGFSFRSIRSLSPARARVTMMWFSTCSAATRNTPEAPFSFG